MMHDGIRDYWTRYLERQPLGVYAVLDAARDPGVLKLISRVGGAEPLFAEPELADVSPYVVAIASAQLARVVGAMWSKSWGVFATSSYPLPAVHGHLRRLSTAQTPAGERMFRFYDPRILRAIAPVCTNDELDELLGPLDRFIVEARSPTAAVEITRLRPHAVGVAA